MAMDSIFLTYSSQDIKHFMKDFLEVVRVASELDRYFVKGEKDFDSYIKNFEKIIKDFNKKYKGLMLKTKKKIDGYELKIFIKEKSLKSFFENAASKIQGVNSIGLKNFNEALVQESEKFTNIVDKIKNSVFVTYSDLETGTSNLAAYYRTKENAVELIIDGKELLNNNSADFKIIAFYGLKEGLNKKIHIHNRLIAFGFYNLLNEIEKREWFERFSPRFLE